MARSTAAASFTSRVLLDQPADKWSVLILGALCPGPLRFNTLKRAWGGVTQSALTTTLQHLERNGVIERRVVQISPIAVEYAITPPGRSLEPLFQALDARTRDHLHEVEAAQPVFDARSSDRV